MTWQWAAIIIALICNIGIILVAVIKMDPPEKNG